MLQAAPTRIKERRVNRIKCGRSESGQIMRMEYRMRTFRTGTLI